MNTARSTATVRAVSFAQSLKAQQPKQQTAKEAIAANVQLLIEQLEQGHSDGLIATTSPRWADFTATHSATSLRLPASGQTRRASLASMRGISLAAR